MERKCSRDSESVPFGQPKSTRMHLSEGRLRHRQGAVRLVRGTPYANRESTLSLLPGAAVGRWLASRSSDIAGALLDLGAGNRPFRQWYTRFAERSVAIDAAPIPGVDAVSYAGALPFRNASFDTVLCTSVLEHVENPEQTVSEIVRVLRPGGRLLVTVPFLYPTHEAPFDYWRTTHYGLRSVLERHGLTVDDLSAQGGPFLLIIHYVILFLVQSLRWVGLRLGRFSGLIDNRVTTSLLAAPQEAVREAVSFRLSSVARVASLGYMAAAHLEDGHI